MSDKLRQLAIKAKTNHGYKLSQDMMAEIETMERDTVELESLASTLMGKSIRSDIKICNIRCTPLLTRIKWVFTGVKI